MRGRVVESVSLENARGGGSAQFAELGAEFCDVVDLKLDFDFAIVGGHFRVDSIDESSGGNFIHCRDADPTIRSSTSETVAKGAGGRHNRNRMKSALGPRL